MVVTKNNCGGCCSGNLRVFKGKTRWPSCETEKSMHRCPKTREKFPYYHFLLGSRLLHSKWREPRTHLTTASSSAHFLNQFFWCSFNLSYVHYFFILFLSINCLSLSSVSASTQDYRTSVTSKEICPSMDIRNNAEQFKQLADCRVIEGFLQIVLMDRTNESDFVNLSFPKLREITGYLLLYRVNGLKTLANIFPNLSVIRGQDLFINYALAVYEMLHMQELGLHSLTDITRGYVFITKNPLMCYIDTIDWSRILNPNATLDANLIFENRAHNACPKCPIFKDRLCGYNNQTKQSLCWNAQHCQRVCPGCPGNRCTNEGECCSTYCLGGCSGTESDHCVTCEKVVWENRCVEKCPSEYFEFKDRRCITEKECYDMPRPREDLITLQLRAKPFKPHDGKCLIDCPHGFGEVAETGADGQKIYKCQKCTGACRKVCEAASVDSIQSAQRLKGCVIINGSLEIQIRGGGSIVKELEESLNMIEEITGYLKIVRSLSLVSLNFLRRLRLIRGETLENGKYVLVVLDNQNLAELWDFSRRERNLKIGRGKIFFHFNPKLCLNKIAELQKQLDIEKVDELEVAPNSNGDKVACNITALKVSVATTTPDHVLITWIPYSHYEMRTLLGYVVYYMEAPANVNVSMTDGRDGCGGDGWSMIDVEVPDPNNNTARDNVTTPITHLKPFTRYAYYVKTYTIATETNGAQSKIQYFRTHPSTPTPPRQLKITTLSHSEVRIQWQPPEQPNGRLISYIVTGELNDGQTLLEQRNYCTEPPDPERKETAQEKEEKKKQLLFPPPTPRPVDDKECFCPYPEVQPKIRKNDQEIQALIEFENKLHDNIYVKKAPADPNIPRSKRDLPTHYSGNMVDLGASGMKQLLLSNENATFAEKNTSKDQANYTTETAFKYEVSNSTLEWTVRNLRHFSEYSISVQACREVIVDEDNHHPTECSTGKMDSVQTLPLEEADKIDPASISVEVANETNSVRLRWEKPNITNGQILTYLIQYKRVEFENQQAQTQCITSHEFDKRGRTYKLSNLPAGNYSVMIKATSLAKESGSYTQPRYFYIKDMEQPVVRQLMLGALFAVSIIIVALVILLLSVRCFYPDSWYHRKLLFATVNPEYFKPAEGYDKWEISRRKIVFDNLLGIGHFGEVYEGRAKGIIQKGVTTKVAIKTLNKSPTNQRTWLNFLNEASVMKQFDTHHVVRLLGVVTKGEPLVIMELMAKGDLRTYLRSCRQDVPEEERKGPVQTPPTLREILQMAAEIADGMLYLSDKKFVHRDLAARNCMINAESTVKIGDFGLTRDVYETDYYRKDSRGHLPVRWMAPESLRDGIFTSRSDVWSYGIVLWEMSTLASLPYTGLGNGEVMPYVINGGVMEEPENCPPILGEIMKLCWQYKYSQRPAFSEILEMLLPNVRDNFSTVSYYHTEDSRQLRVSNAEAVAEEDTPYTPLRIMEDFENFSLDSDDDEDGEDENDYDNGDAVTGHEGNSSSANASLRSLPTVNGYIRRPHNLIPLVNTKTTSC